MPNQNDVRPEKNSARRTKLTRSAVKWKGKKNYKKSGFLNPTSKGFDQY